MGDPAGDLLPPLTWRSWLVLALFIVTTVFVIWPVAFSIPLPGPRQKRWRLRVAVDMKLAPWLAILLLLASTAIKFTREVVHGFVGGDGIEPYAVVILIFALAYICISLDESGLLSYIAMLVTRRWGRNGRALLLCFYVLSTVMALLTNNDVAVLCLTPIVCVFSDTTGIPAEPFLMAMFIAANTASMALFIGNPTNIIVAQANHISFLSYTAWMGLPFLGAAAAGAAVLHVASLRSVPRAIHVDIDLRPRDMIRRAWQAALGASVLVACLVTLSVSSLFGVTVWVVTLPFGGAMLAADIAIDLYSTRAAASPQAEQTAPAADGDGGGACDKSSASESNAHIEAAATEPPCNHPVATESQAATIEDASEPAKEPAGPARQLLGRWLHTAKVRLPTVVAVVQRLPYGIIPFVLGMFIIVEALTDQGWTPRLAWLLKHMCPSVTAAVFVVGAVSTLACNLLNNLPMTILFSRAFQHAIFAQVDDATRRGAMFALIIGSNLGANLTLVGSLAGLMFQNIAQQKGRNIDYFMFMRWCAPAMVVQLAVSCGILAAELAIKK
ncbi:hypothetical protein H4R19_001085 [Coemansia spiralis]|nr:hypothetical protein H4R19_001085 [Coemansia spiralis]